MFIHESYIFTYIYICIYIYIIFCYQSVDGIVLFSEWLACARPTRTHFLWKRSQVFFFFLLSTQHTKVRCSEALRPWPANQAMAVATDAIATFFFSSVHNKICRSIFSYSSFFFSHPPQTWALTETQATKLLLQLLALFMCSFISRDDETKGWTTDETRWRRRKKKVSATWQGVLRWLSSPTLYYSRVLPGYQKEQKK